MKEYKSALLDKPLFDEPRNENSWRHVSGTKHRKMRNHYGEDHRFALFLIMIFMRLLRHFSNYTKAEIALMQ
jgi:hypothetical protein